MTSQDKEFARWMRDNGVLQDFEGSKLDLANGVIAVMCGDGDQMVDRFHFLERTLERAGHKPRIHLVTRHGGVLRAAESSPLNKPGHTTDVDLIEEIEEAVGLKRIKTVLLEAHGPCSKAMAHNLSLEATTSVHIAAKRRLRDLLSEVIFATVYHIDWGDRRCYYRFAPKILTRLKSLQSGQVVVSV